MTEPPREPTNPILETPEIIAVLWTDLRDVLRANGDWRVRLDVHAAYGTIGVEVLYLSQVKYTDQGMSLYKRLFNAMAYLHGQGVTK